MEQRSWAASAARVAARAEGAATAILAVKAGVAKVEVAEEADSFLPPPSMPLALELEAGVAVGLERLELFPLAAIQVKLL